MLAVSLVPCHGQQSNFPFALISPNGGQTFAIGDTIPIKVSCSSPYILCFISLFVGISSNDITQQFSPFSDTLLFFVVPPTYTETISTDSGPTKVSVSTVSNECLMHLEHYNFPEEYDESDSFFSIIANPIIFIDTLKGPFSVGDPISLRWRASDKIKGATIDFSTDSGATWSAITPGIITRDSTTWGNFSFSIPASAAGTQSGLIRISSSDGTYSAVSSPAFSVSEQEKKGNCGCGSGTGLALIPWILTRTPLFRRKKRRTMSV
jgi:hypothetical protein